MHSILLFLNYACLFEAVVYRFGCTEMLISKQKNELSMNTSFSILDEIYNYLGAYLGAMESETVSSAL
jgi:hypothetical protein